MSFSTSVMPTPEEIAFAEECKRRAALLNHETEEFVTRLFNSDLEGR